MTAPTSSAAPGRDVAAESALAVRLVELRMLDARLSTAGRILGGGVLLLVLTCACVLIALPNFLTFGCRAVQAEAKGELRRVFIVEGAFRTDHERYGTSADELGFTSTGGPREHYAYLVRAEDRPNGPGFVAFAVGTGSMAGDLWTVDERGEPRNLRDKCTY